MGPEACEDLAMPFWAPLVGAAIWERNLVGQICGRRGMWGERDVSERRASMKLCGSADLVGSIGREVVGSCVFGFPIALTALAVDHVWPR